MKLRKLKVVDKGFYLYFYLLLLSFISKKQYFSTSISEASKIVYLFVSLSRLVSFGVCINIQYFFDVVRNKLQTINIYQNLSKEDQKFKKRASHVNVP